MVVLLPFPCLPAVLVCQVYVTCFRGVLQSPWDILPVLTTRSARTRDGSSRAVFHWMSPFLFISSIGKDYTKDECSQQLNVAVCVQLCNYLSHLQRRFQISLLTSACQTQPDSL